MRYLRCIALLVLCGQCSFSKGSSVFAAAASWILPQPVWLSTIVLGNLAADNCTARCSLLFSRPGLTCHMQLDSSDGSLLCLLPRANTAETISWSPSYFQPHIGFTWVCFLHNSPLFCLPSSIESHSMQDLGLAIYLSLFAARQRCKGRD